DLAPRVEQRLPEGRGRVGGLLLVDDLLVRGLRLDQLPELDLRARDVDEVRRRVVARLGLPEEIERALVLARFEELVAVPREPARRLAIGRGHAPRDRARGERDHRGHDGGAEACAGGSHAGLAINSRSWASSFRVSEGTATRSSPRAPAPPPAPRWPPA